MELVKRDIRPRDIVTMAALRNAITVDMALGCSTNSALHLPAIAREAGLRLDLKLLNEISERTPNLCHLAPAGEHYMEELEAAVPGYPIHMDPLSLSVACHIGPGARAVTLTKALPI